MNPTRTLLLMRHAKSSWKDVALSDEKRPLNKRGREAARFMGAYLSEHGLAPHGILVSSAERAQETARRLNKSGNFTLEIQTAPEMYLAGAAAYIAAIGKVDASIGRLLVIGHNPDLEDVIHRLTGCDESMPTGAVAHVEVDAPDWGEFALKPRGTLVNVFRPKEVAGDRRDD